MIFNSDKSLMPKFFGRRQGRVVRKAKAFLLENLLPKILISTKGNFSKNDMFGNSKKEICLEIGFGDGQHIFGQAKKHPENGYVGVEVFKNGVANLLSLMSEIKEGDNLPDDVKLEDCCVNNIRVYDDDVRLLFQNIPDAFFDKVFLLFPDPWPKKKHAGRRFVNPDNLKEVSRVLKKGGLFRIATDHKIYKKHVLQTMYCCPDFEWTAKCGNDWKHEPSDWVRTKYQMKAIREGRKPVFFDYRKV